MFQFDVKLRTGLNIPTDGRLKRCSSCRHRAKLVGFTGMLVFVRSATFGVSV